MNPEPTEFYCPDCGRHCLLIPVFDAKGIRTGQKIKHELPACKAFQTMPGADYLKMATYANIVLEEDPHVSWKEKPTAPKLISIPGAAALQQKPPSIVAVPNPGWFNRLRQRLGGNKAND
jgi:hypothetical protein